MFKENQTIHEQEQKHKDGENEDQSIHEQQHKDKDEDKGDDELLQQRQLPDEDVEVNYSNLDVRFPQSNNTTTNLT